MPWYKAGTVSVTLNSNAVTGSGTAFISSCRVGDAFRGPDGAWYEVTNIASDTAMSITPNYQGATASAGTYAVAPMQGYVKDSADALRSLANQYSAKLAALGTTGNYDTLPVAKGGTGATDLNALAKSGANTDITSLTGLTTALSVAQGGTGGKTQVAARSGLGLGAAAVAAILGSVSQSGGTPTGAIIEFGSNSNGEYTKFADGTMICRSHAASQTAASAASGSMFTGSSVVTFTFPATFTSFPRCTPITIRDPASTGPCVAFVTSSASGTNPSTTQVSLNILSTISGGNAYLGYIAIGRWF